jgi:hypothetical protein
MKSRLLVTLIGSAGLLVGASSIASAQSCSEQIASLQSMMGSTANSSGASTTTGALDPATMGDTGGQGSTGGNAGAPSTGENTASSDESDSTTEELQTGSTATNNSAAAALQEAITANAAGDEAGCLTAIERARSAM